MADGLKFLVKLLYAPGATGRKAEAIRGTTRLEKLTFLAQREYNVPTSYDFEAYDYGPWSSDVVDDCDALRGSKLIDVDEEPLALAYQEGDEIVSEDQLPDWNDAGGPASGKLRTYKLTSLGEAAASKLWQQTPPAERNQITTLKQTYNGVPLTELLRYVYEKYPDMAKKSKIAASLSRRGSRPWLRAQRTD